MIKAIIIDDEYTNRILIKKYLDELDLELYEAQNGKEGLELIKKNKPNLILLDIRMPVLDGFDVLDRIKKMEFDIPIHTIVLTAHQDLNTIKKAFDFGANDYVQKPFQALELKIRVNNQVKQIVAQKKLLEGEKMKIAGIFGATVAHEMNQPLCAISMLLSLYKEKYGENDIIVKILNQNNKLTDLVKKFSSIGKLITMPYAGSSEIIDLSKSTVKQKTPNEKARETLIVIIDDQQEYADIISFYLTLKNIKNITFNSIHDARSFLKNNNPAAFIINAYSEDRKGMAFATQLSSQFPHTKTIIYSDYKLSQNEMASLCQNSIVFNNPMDLNQLHKILKTVFYNEDKI